MMMSDYNPFQRGPVPVGVTSFEFTDPGRDRRLAVECWYPASEAARGKDLDPKTQDRFVLMPAFPRMRQAAVREAEPAAGKFPLVIFSHGLAGHRRQTTHLCTHLASHGYVVAAMDHTGNTMPDILQLAMQVQKSRDLGRVMSALTQSAADRPLDVSSVIDRMLTGEMGPRIDPGRIGMSGHSFGGWTTLAVISRDDRIKAALPLAPAGGRSRTDPSANLFADSLRLAWDRKVPTLLLAAELDSLLPLDGMTEFFQRIASPKIMVVLRNADHFHFCDGVEVTHEMFRKMGGLSFVLGPEGQDRPSSMKNAKPASELCPGPDAYRFLDGLGLAQMDAHLKANPAAQEFLADGLEKALAEASLEADILAG